MIEKLARAIAASIGDDPDSPADDMGTLVAYGDEAKEWQTWIPEARACLEALREPSEEMCLGAEDEGVLVGCCNIDARSAREVWQAMIDVALERKAA